MKDLELIASRAASRNLEFLLAGGHAVVAHHFNRNTFDIDLVIPGRDRVSWLELAKELGYQFWHEGPVFLQFKAARPDGFPLDLMLMSVETFEKMKAEAVTGPFGVPGLKVVSLLHLLALKCHAVKHGHSGRLVKDAHDLVMLVINNRLDPNSDDVRGVFEKHGTPELYEKVKKACSA